MAVTDGGGNVIAAIQSSFVLTQGAAPGSGANNTVGWFDEAGLTPSSNANLLSIGQVSGIVTTTTPNQTVYISTFVAFSSGSLNSLNANAIECNWTAIKLD